MRKKLIVAGAFFILLITIGLGVSYYNEVGRPVVAAKVVIEIEKGDTFGKITQKLLSQNVTVEPFWFKLLAYQKGVINQLKAGEYELSPGMTSSQVLAKIASSKALRYSITFPEGWNLKEILHALSTTANLEKTLANASSAEVAAKLGINDKNPEGWVFPDTYQFEKNESDISILKRAYQQMQQVLDDEWQHKAANLPYKSPYEALIMASIVEKETGAKSERAKIAGVFIRRLAKGMLLQTDPTVIYGMGDRYKGNIRASDLTTKTAYNTYVIAGLPPTPIAMPGRDAIHAALHPEPGDSLYFVAKGDGSHQFSSSLTDHNHAVDVFQKHKK